MDIIRDAVDNSMDIRSVYSARAPIEATEQQGLPMYTAIQTDSKLGQHRNRRSSVTSYTVALPVNTGQNVDTEAINSKGSTHSKRATGFVAKLLSVFSASENISEPSALAQTATDSKAKSSNDEGLSVRTLLLDSFLYPDDPAEEHPFERAMSTPLPAGLLRSATSSVAGNQHTDLRRRAAMARASTSLETQHNTIVSRLSSQVSVVCCLSFGSVLPCRE